MHRIAVICCCLFGLLSAAEPKKAAPKDLPKVIVASPLGLAPGAKTRLTLRGLRLDSAAEVRCQEPKAVVRLLKKEKVGVPRPEDLPRLGDTQVEAEVTLPADYRERTVAVTVRTPDGESPPHELVIDRGKVVDEKEPNGGFRQAQPVELPTEVQGRIDPPQDVDLYRFEAKAGQRLVGEVFAARLGSPLDARLMLYDAAGRVLGAGDDTRDSADPRLEALLPRDGTYFLGVTDAGDQGGPVHVYRLRVELRRP